MKRIVMTIPDNYLNYVKKRGYPISKFFRLICRGVRLNGSELLMKQDIDDISNKRKITVEILNGDLNLKKQMKFSEIFIRGVELHKNNKPLFRKFVTEKCDTSKCKISKRQHAIKNKDAIKHSVSNHKVYKNRQNRFEKELSELLDKIF